MTMDQLVEHVKAYHEATGHSLFFMTEDEGRVALAVIGNSENLSAMAMGATARDEQAAGALAAIFGPVVFGSMLGKHAGKQKPPNGFDVPN